MFRTIARLGGVSSARIWTQQARTQAVGSNRLSLASFHIGTNPNAVNVSSNAATTPSTPLPPPMATSTLNKTTGVPSKESATAATGASSSSEDSESESEQELELEEGNGSSGFAEATPISPEQARSLEDNPILKQLVNTIMKDGKKARAQRFVADALLEIRSRTQTDPYQVVLDALELASPILKLTPIKKGSKVLQVPNPMTERQRRRKAIVWILEASDKRKGEKEFKDRLASEFLAVVNGNSGALAKKNQQHKMALANRANASLNTSPIYNPQGETNGSPVQFNTFEIERSFQELLKKQPVASSGPSFLHGKVHRQPSKDSKPRHFLWPNAQSHLGVKLPRRSPSINSNSNNYNNSNSNNGNNTLSTSLSYSPVFGSPASEHARHWIKTVGRDHLSDSESERRESDHEGYEESQQQQWQIDYECDVADQIELDTETAEIQKQPDSNASSWTGATNSQISSDQSHQALGQPSSTSRSSSELIKDQHSIHPLSSAPNSPYSGPTTPKIPQSRSSLEIRPQTVHFAADVPHNFDIVSVPPIAVNQPLPPLPAPPSTIPDKIRTRVKQIKNSEPRMNPPKSNLLAVKPALEPLEKQPVSLTNPPRKCIHHGKILQVINVSTVKERYLFLFSDIMLIAKHMSEGKPTLDSRFQVKDVIELKKISLSLTRDKYDTKNGESGALGNRKIPPILAEFIHTFDQNPNRALNNFVQKRALHPDPISVAHLLFKTPELSKAQLALFLSNQANKYVYRAFLDQCQFAGVLLDEALRTLLSRLSLPDRVVAQRTGKPSERIANGVDYLLEEFTKRWYEANVNVVVFDASIAHKLVIAMIVLNAQLHNNDGASIVKDREEVSILVRPRIGSQPSTPTISSIPVMESNLIVPPTFTAQQYMTMDLDDLTAFPTPTKESFVEMFQLLDQQRIVPRDTLYNIYLSICHQPLDIDFEKMDAPTRTSDSVPATGRKLWPIMVSPAALPPRLILKIPSDPITITIPVLNPHFSIHLGGRDLKCEPSVLEFGSHRSQRFRVTGSVPGKKTLTIQPRIAADKGAPEQYYDLQNLPSRHTIAIERQFMRHTFQVSLLNDLGTRRRYLFGASTAAEKDEWARVLTDCLLVAKGQNAVRLNEHTGLEQSIGLQILKELLLGVEASDDDEMVPSQANGQAEPVPLPIPVVPTPTMGLGIPMDGHMIPVANPRASVVPNGAVMVAAAAGHASPTLGAGTSTEWPSSHNGGSTSPNDTWLCKMPKPGSIVPDRYGWELVRLVEQNSLMALMLGFMGALGRDRLRRMEAVRRSMEEDALLEEEDEEYEDYELEGELEDEEYEYEEEYFELLEGDDVGLNGDERRVPFIERPAPQVIEINVEYVPDASHTGTTGSDAEIEQEAGHIEGNSHDADADSAEQGYDSEDGVLSSVVGRVRKVKGKEIWWTQ
ncbi:hypothetical protein BGX26_005337 [Mortierella sp. AD094]|nr:hypothetical protein BGX26_005337 [Mortierella sp. AD094]